MLCEKCGQREATIYVTECGSPGGITGKKNLCEECGKDGVSDFEKFKESQRAEWLRAVEPIPAKNSRCTVSAYEFVCEAMSIAQVMKNPFGEVLALTQISAKELMEVLRTLALLRLGKGARQHLNGWGVRRCEDFGVIVSNLMDADFFPKRIEGGREDFQGGYNFDEAFPPS
jgi:uncharacterized repeat protein (TIGR04138 family)